LPEEYYLRKLSITIRILIRLIMKYDLREQKVEGKTYSLFGNSEVTDGYYQLISKLADEILGHTSGINNAISELDKFIRHQGHLVKFKSSSYIEEFFPRLKDSLSVYTPNVKSHLNELSLYKRVFDKRLGTTEDQYHLYMLKIELVNRLYKNDFIKCNYKIALLPHCLKDLSKECKSEADDFDYTCKGCSKNCYINAVSQLLKEHDIHPYIWMKADLKKLLYKSTRRCHVDQVEKNLGILGIACIPELESGMRKCVKAGIPVVGLPLNANRCGRWFGEFYDNSINMDRLKQLFT